jgi:hypothetical protein
MRRAIARGDGYVTIYAETRGSRGGAPLHSMSGAGRPIDWTRYGDCVGHRGRPVGGS